jgi:hypothetical protein
MGGACSTYGGQEVRTGFWWGNLRERDHLENLGVRWEYNVKKDIHEVEWGACTGLMWLKIGKGGGHL